MKCHYSTLVARLKETEIQIPGSKLSLLLLLFVLLPSLAPPLHSTSCQEEEPRASNPGSWRQFPMRASGVAAVCDFCNAVCCW